MQCSLGREADRSLVDMTRGDMRVEVREVLRLGMWRKEVVEALLAAVRYREW